MMSRAIIATLLLFLYAFIADVNGATAAPPHNIISAGGGASSASGLRGTHRNSIIIENDINNTQDDVHLTTTTSHRQTGEESSHVQPFLPPPPTIDHHNHNHRSLRPDNETNDNDVIIITQPLSFQIVMSIILGILAIGQIALFTTFYINQSKRVLEFAQPMYVCMFIASGLITTVACYLYLYITNVGCILREPLIFISLSVMGAIIASRAWRISMLMSNPLMNAGRGSEGEGKGPSRIERIRQFVMTAISALSGCDYSGLTSRKRGGHSSGRPLRVQINFMQMMKAILILCIPQICLQVVVMGLPALRYTKTLSVASATYYENTFTGTFGQYQCQSSTSASWTVYTFSVIFVILPFICAYLLNLRPQVEMEKLPQIIDERTMIKFALLAVCRVVLTNAPVIGLTYYYQCPAIRAYVAIVVVAGIPFIFNYYIAYIKLGALKNKKMPQVGGASTFSAFSDNGGGDVTGRGSAAYAVKMAEMYSKIGRTEETLELIDETLDVWKTEEKSGGGFALGEQRRQRETVGAGFTKQDLEKLGAEELEMILQLLIIKGDALMKLHGFAAFPLSAELNINAMRIFEACPASKKMKDISIMFPIYNRVGIQLKGGVINQDDSCNLEKDLYSKFYYESQVQSFHLVRSLGALAEWYGRIGSTDKAFRYFDTMTRIYMPKEHAPLINEHYSVNRCAITYAVSALWYLQKGQPKQAIQRCDQVINEILPSYDKKDVVGLYHIIWPIIRVLKWNGEVEKARKFYDEWTDDAVGDHFAVGSLHKPMKLLLKICDGNPDGDYETDDMGEDIDMILEFDAPDMTDLNFITDGWSVKSMAAELCLHLARRLEPGNIARRDLIDRGIQMSTMANERNTTEEGLIKHIMAHEAHKGIDDRLLALRKEDNAVDVSVIYNKEDLHATLTGVSALGLTTNVGTRSNYTSFDFASKFKVSGSGVGKSSSKSSAGGSGVRFSSKNSSENSAMSTGPTTKRFFSNSSNVSKSSAHPRRHSSVASRHSSVASCGSIAEESTAEITPEITP